MFPPKRLDRAMTNLSGKYDGFFCDIYPIKKTKFIFRCYSLFKTQKVLDTPAVTEFRFILYKLFCSLPYITRPHKSNKYMNDVSATNAGPRACVYLDFWSEAVSETADRDKVVSVPSSATAGWATRL